MPALRRRRSGECPPGYERDVTLHDGRVVHLRPILPTDLDELRREVATADPETLRSRFLGARPPDTDEEFERLVCVDYDHRFAIVAIDDDGRGVGIARYESTRGSDSAEVAAAVDVGWRRVGLATAMLRLLGEAAVRRGIRRFTMEFLVENVDVTSLISDAHLPLSLISHNGVAEVAVDLPELPSGAT